MKQTHRGHIRPLLHTSLNLLSRYPKLYLTILVAPSYGNKIQQELNFLDSLEPKPPIGRLQLIPGSNEASNYAKAFQEALPGIITSLIRGKKEMSLGPEVENRFSNYKLSFVVFDVTTFVSPSRISISDQCV